MKLLVLTYDLPYPLDAGGKIRAYNLIKFLSKSYDIYLLSFVRNLDQEQYTKHLRVFTKQINIVKRGSIWSIQNLFKSLFSSRPLAINAYEVTEMRQKIKHLLSQVDIDMVLLESFYTSGYIDAFAGERIILGTENTEYLFYKRYTDNLKLTSNLKLYLLKLPMYWDVLKMKFFEKLTWRKARLVLAVSEIDAGIIRKHTQKEVVVVPNGVDLEFFSQIKKAPHSGFRAVFVGNWKYVQNVDAALYLIKEIWPEVEKKGLDLTLWLVGRNPPAKLRRLEKDNIRFITEVRDIREVYSQVDLSLIPIRAASGTRLKVLEALASQVPVISTKIGVEGIDVTEDVQYLNAQDPIEFVDKIGNLIENKALVRKITKAGLELVKKKYDWKVLVSDLNIRLEKLYV